MKKLTELLNSGKFLMLLLMFLVLLCASCSEESVEPVMEETPEPELIEILTSPKEYSFKANTCSYENSIDSIMIENIDSLENLTVDIEFGIGEQEWLVFKEINVTTGKFDLETMVEDLPKGKYAAQIILNADNAETAKIIEAELEIVNTVQSFGWEEIAGKVIFTLDILGIPPESFNINYDYERFFDDGLMTKLSDLNFSCSRSEVIKEHCWPVGTYRLTFDNFNNCSLLRQSQFVFTIKENEVQIISLRIRCS